MAMKTRHKNPHKKSLRSRTYPVKKSQLPSIIDQTDINIIKHEIKDISQKHLIKTSFLLQSNCLGVCNWLSFSHFASRDPLSHYRAQDANTIRNYDCQF